MKTKLYIPNKIKVGFNLREDTYTKKLGYVIYHDGKVWRKETSWESWRQKEGDLIYDGFNKKVKLGSEINPIEFDNVPTEGFVLNKKAGGTSWGWNPRATYCRVFDPRGFEFEISIPNLLFILQECNAMKGKGLEGEFVYAWDGKDLVLLPVNCEEYRASTNFTKLQSGKVSTKDLVEGCIYKDKQLNDYVYLGKFNWFDGHSVNKNYVFYSILQQKNSWGSTIERLCSFNGLGGFVQKVSETPVENYAELMDIFNKSSHSGTLKNVELEKYSPPTIMNGYHYINDSVLLDLGHNTYEIYKVIGNRGDSYIKNYSYEYTIRDYNLSCNKQLIIKDDDFIIKTIKPKIINNVSINDVKAKNFKTLTIQKNKKRQQIIF